MWRFWIPAAVVLAADQWSKQLVLRHLPYQQSHEVVPDFLRFTHVDNTGTAFGMFDGGGWKLVAVALLASVGIILYWRHLHRTQGHVGLAMTLALALPLGGALGNALDRMRHGKVIDFIDVGSWVVFLGEPWPIFNVADSAITVGAVLFALVNLLHREPQPAVEGAADSPAPPEASS